MRLCIAFASIILVGASAAWAAEIPASSKIESVTVFPSGAEVLRVAKLKIEKGEHVVVVNDIAASAVPGSIRVEGKATGKLDIGSVDARRLFIPRNDSEAANTERRKLEDELELLRDERSRYEAEVQSAETQKTLIGNLAQMPTRPAPAAGGAERGEDWPQILALIVSGSREAQRTLVEAQVKIRELDHRIGDLEKRLTEVAPEKEERTEVKIHVVAAAPVDADISVLYQVPSASWLPAYDARLATGAKNVVPKLDLLRRASITQRTGESWNDVSILLSTTRPTAGAAAPDLEPITVDYEPVFVPRPVAAAPPAPMAAGRAEAPADMAGAETETDEHELEKVRKRAEEKTVEVEQQKAAVIAAPFQAIYAVPGRLSIPETGEAKRVQLLEESIEPLLAVRTVPKEDTKAFLYAKMMLPRGGSPLLPGTVSLFRDGTFVGTGQLPVLNPGEEHELGFGIDDLVRVKYAVAEEKKGETGLISSSRTDSRNYRITVKNMHERAIQLSVLDQVPVSKNQEIKVEYTGRTPPTKQNVDDKRGVVGWETKLEPDQEQVIEFGYRMTWPAAKNIVLGR
jgi:uncharacterized protein (TIGR02231 family)